MKINILLAEFYHWGSDVKTELLSFDNVDVLDAQTCIENCTAHAYWNNVNHPYVSILIDPSPDVENRTTDR